MMALHHLMTLLPYGAYTQFVSQPPAQHVKVDVQLLCNVCMKVERENLPVVRWTLRWQLGH